MLDFGRPPFGHRIPKTPLRGSNNDKSIQCLNSLTVINTDLMIYIFHQVSTDLARILWGRLTDWYTR